MTFTGHEYSVASAVFNSNATVVLTSSDDRSAKIWSTTTGTCLLTFSGHEDALNTATFSSDDTLVLTSSNDDTAKMWKSTSGLCLRTFTGHSNLVITAIFPSTTHRLSPRHSITHARCGRSQESARSHWLGTQMPSCLSAMRRPKWPQGVIRSEKHDHFEIQSVLQSTLLQSVLQSTLLRLPCSLAWSWQQGRVDGS